MQNKVLVSNSTRTNLQSPALEHMEFLLEYCIGNMWAWAAATTGAAGH
jgi:hypothetical protein